MWILRWSGCGAIDEVKLSVVRFRIFCGTLITDGHRYANVALVVEKGRIVRWEPFESAHPVSPPDVDARHLVALPGMIDIHIHGGGGRDLMEGTPEAIQTVARHLTRYGVTGFLVTPLTAPMEAIHQVVQSAREVRMHGSEGAQVLGVHMEGPFINPKRAGAQPPEFIQPPSVETLERELGDLVEELRVVTLAPEVEGGYELTEWLSRQGIIVSIGHTDATYEEVTRAIDLGARHATHCFNAMRPLLHREPGPLGAIVECEQVRGELIADGVHVHPAAARILLRALGPQRAIVVTDALACAGLPDAEFEFNGQPARVIDGVARLADGTITGSVLTMDQALRNIVQIVGVPLREAIGMLTLNPATSAGVADRKGRLAPGYDADLVILDDDLQLQATICRGKLAWAREEWRARLAVLA